jgi:hypothetical protein
MRLLVWIILGVVVYLALRKKSQNIGRPDAASGTWNGERNGSDSNSKKTTAGVAQGQGETMVCCVQCQVYVPASEAIVRGDKAYCCQAHADLVR